FKAILIGDIQIGAGDDGYGYDNATNWNTLLNHSLKYNDDTSFIISCGDQTNAGDSTEEWAAALAPEALRNIPMSTCIGNHDKKGYLYRHYVNNPNEYQSIIPNVFGNQYYYRYGDVLFVNFNTTSFNIFAAYNVAERAIMENPDAKWRVAIFHHDIYGTGHHAEDDDNYLLQGIFASVLDKFDFDLAFTGHEHYYGRSYNMKNNEIVPLDYTKNSVTDPDGTLYITTASASGRNRMYDEPFDHPWLNFEYMSEELIYSTVEFTDTTFKLRTYTVENDNKLIDEYTITKTDTTYEEIDENDNILNGTNAVGRVLKHFTGDFYVVIETVSEFLLKFLGFIKEFI
ncbi:MAG: metallophosphoesterase, partial [Clostridia bacterium]|nr:metallophosphoesterase [Clostridia bacterium]